MKIQVKMGYQCIAKWDTKMSEHQDASSLVSDLVSETVILQERKKSKLKFK